MSEEFAGNDEVVFLGLTPEDSSALSESENFLKTNGVPWANGIGAGAAIEALEIKAYPTEIVFGRDGKVVWHNSLPGDTASAIKKALAAG